MSGLGFSVDGSATDAEPRQTVLSSFRKRRLRVDWRAVATLDLERLVRDMDVQSLQENVMNVAFCDIEREDFSIDSNFLKLFKLAQLIIEYVLYCQKQLEVQAGNSRKQADELHKVELELRQQVATLQQDLTAVRRENKKRRKMLEAAQSLMNAGANGYHKCSMCAKAFVSDAFLQSHMQRRHGEQISLTLADGMMQQHSDRLKQAVEAARQEAMENARAQYQVELQNGLRGMQEKMETVTHEFRSEISRMEEAATQARESDLAKWRRAEEERRQRELAGLEQKIQLLESEKADAQTEIAELRSQQLKRSNLGDLEDDDEAGSRRQSQLQQQEQLQLEQREEHQNEISQVRTEFADELRKQERKWKKQLRDMEAKHHLELEQASNRMALVERELQESQRQSTDDHFGENLPDGRQLRQSTKQLELASEVAVMVRTENLGSQREFPSTGSPSLTATGKEPYSIRDTKASSQPGAQGKPVTKAQPLSDVSQTDDSDDDLDVSSYKGSVSHEIAASIQHSRQKEQPTRQTIKVQQKSPGMHKKEDAVLENGRESPEDEDEADSKSPGEFAPFESHPAIKTRYSHSAMTLESQREEVMDLLDEELERKGISVDSERLSMPQFKDKMAALEKEREVLSKKHRNVFEIRRKKESEIDKIVRRSYKPASAEAAGKPPRTPKQPQGLGSSGTSNQYSARPPAPTPGKALSTVQPVQQLSGNDESDDETGSLTETITESPTPSTSPEQQRAANRPMAILSTDVSTVRGKPAMPQPYTSTPAQSGTSLAEGVQLVKRGSNFTDGSENALISKIPSHSSSQKQETSWDSEGSSLSETEKDVQPHIVKLFSGQPSSEPSTQQGGMSGRLSSRRGTEEVQMRQDSSTLKQGTGKVAALANRLSASVSLSPDPSKRPKGGVALFGGPAVDRGAAGMLDDDDDFSSVTDMEDFSESKQIGSLQPDMRDVSSRPPVKVPSSAVTAFNQRDDFSDLDDDLETTNLQH